VDTSRIEKLLEEISSKLDDLIQKIRDTNGELNWIKEHSFAKQVVDKLFNIECESANFK
jgi:hypothetical protein